MRCAILERGDLQQPRKLAKLDEDQAASAADMLAAAEILEPGRPLAFSHPIVRAGIYAELSSGQRAAGIAGGGPAGARPRRQ